MNPKERILAALNREPLDRIPVDIWHTPEIAEAMRRECRVDTDFEMWKTLSLDKIVWDFMDYRSESGDRAGAQSGAGAETGGTRTMWGVPLKNVQAGEAVYAEFGEAPLAGYDNPQSLDRYPYWPRVDRFEYGHALELARSASDHFVVIGPWVSLFEIYCQMRGLEQALMDVLDLPDLVDAVLDRVEQIQTGMMQRFLPQAAGLVDLVFISDDIAGQKSLLISPKAWHRHLQPRLKRWCDLIHTHGMKVFYHTDGAARPLLGPILDCGVDVLNPIQHACPGMEISELKREFGDRVIFHGGIDNQEVLPRGTMDAVRKEVRECMRVLGAGRRGYICCSCHNIQPGTPMENILTMIETVQKEGCL